MHVVAGLLRSSRGVASFTATWRERAGDRPRRLISFFRWHSISSVRRFGDFAPRWRGDDCRVRRGLPLTVRSTRGEGSTQPALLPTGTRLLLALLRGVAHGEVVLEARLERGVLDGYLGVVNPSCGGSRGTTLELGEPASSSSNGIGSYRGSGGGTGNPASLSQTILRQHRQGSDHCGILGRGSRECS